MKVIETDVEELVEGLKNGDERAQVAFWQMFEQPVLKSVMKVLGDCVDAFDTTVDVLTDFMVKYVHNLSEPRAMGAYLSLMASRRAWDLKKMRTRNRPLDYEISDNNSLDPEERAMWAALMPKLDRCLEKLTPKAKMALRFKYVRQQTNEKIGALFDVSKQFIGREIGKSLKVLRRCIENQGAMPKTEETKCKPR